MFFNNYYNEYEIMNESMGLDDFEIALYAENMTGDYSDALTIIAESDEEFFNLQEKMMKLEHCAIVSEDSSLLYEGVSEFKDKASNGLKKTWEKIKAFFRKLKEWLASVIKNDEKFLSKYEQSLLRATGTSEVNFDLAPFDRTLTAGAFTKIIGTIDRGGHNFTKENVKDEVAREIGFSTYKDMKSEMNEKVRKKSSLNGKTAIKVIKDYAADKKYIDNLEKQSDEFFKKAMSEAKKNSEGSEKKEKLGMLKGASNVLTNYIGIAASLLKERKNHVRAAAVKLVKGGKDDSKKSESYMFGYGSVLDRF